MNGEFAIAVHALVFLNHIGKTQRSEVVAKNVCTNPARLRKVMASLKKHNLIETKEGVDGGYLFALKPKEVTLFNILEALEQKVVAPTWRSGGVEKKCQIAAGMAGVMDEIYKDMDAVCKKRLSHITIYDIDKIIFAGS